MTPERYKAIDAVFQAAAELTPSERAGYLDAACAGDAEMRREVESLLEYDRAEIDIANAVGEASAAWSNQERHPERLGVYRITGVIGRGGMGIVYSAVRDDDAFHKKVAVKLVKRGMDTELVLARFRSERNILARLDHPNIARMLDGGSAEDGRPYFVMEFVEGVPITRYCQEKQLDGRARIQLFLEVCAAVQHAHRHMVVHRDLKPGNILVTPEGSVKLLDFGIAKALEPEEGDSFLQTALEPTVGMRMMTPAYASPEQALGMPVSAASDVYSLGTVLYELLAGKPAFEFQGIPPKEIEAAICGQVPEPPSRCPQGLRHLEGDLDNIVLMALRKEPERRYATAEHLADDLRRALSNRPVHARADTLAYRSAKFLRRNRVTVAASVIVAASLIAGTAISLFHARRAERRFDQLRKLASSLLYDVHDEIRDLAGSTKARKRIVTIGLEYLDGLARDASGDMALQADLASAYERVGDVQGGVQGAHLGDIPGAIASYRKALDLLAAAPASVARSRRMAALYAKVGENQAHNGGLKEALASYRKALELMEGPARERRQVEDRMRLASIYESLFPIQSRQGLFAEALDSSTKHLALRRELFAENPSKEATIRLASAEEDHSNSLQLMGNLKEALPHAQAALQLREAQAKEEPDSSEAQHSLIVAYSHAADVLGTPALPSLGGAAEAIAVYRKMILIAEKAAARDPSDNRALLDLANSLQRLGSALVSSGSYAEAIQCLGRATELYTRLERNTPNDNRMREGWAFALMRDGDAERLAGHWQPAIDSYRQSIAVCQKVLATDASEALIRITLYTSWRGLGLGLARAGNRREALQAGAQSVDAAEQYARLVTGNARARYHLPYAYSGMGLILRGLGDATACTWLERSNADYARLAQQSPMFARDRSRWEEVKAALAGCGYVRP
ncbi:MAG: serine/threonine-protein kinase [Bryobacteraceae bacterium]